LIFERDFFSARLLKLRWLMTFRNHLEKQLFFKYLKHNLDTQVEITSTYLFTFILEKGLK